MKIEVLTGDAFDAALPDVARLRIGIFREWPYLYDGTLTYEANYLQSYRASKNAILVAARDRGKIVGVSTGAPLLENADDFGAALAGHPIDPATVFHFSESLLLPEYRGRGIGHKFFDLREAHARRLGFCFACFYAVVRDEDHPSRPPDYRPLDLFWRARGYAPLAGAQAHYAWKSIGDEDETPKQLQFWLRAL